MSIPLVEFPESSLNPNSEVVDWGWVNLDSNIIFIPRKTFYLSNEELVDTAVHETCHLLTKERGHINGYWRPFYIQQREKVFTEFSDFVSLKNPQIKFEKGYKIYPDDC